MKVRIKPISQPELWAMVAGGCWDKLSLEEKTNLSNCLAFTTILWAGFVDGDLVCVFGVAPQTLVSNSAYLWVWTTEKVKDHEFIFVRQSQIVVKALLDQYDRLYGVCESRADRSRRWLKWLGATFEVAKSGWVPFEIRAG